MTRIQPTNAEVEAVLDKLREQFGDAFDAHAAIRAHEPTMTYAAVIEPEDDISDDGSLVPWPSLLDDEYTCE